MRLTAGASRTGTGCQVIYADGSALVVYDARCAWFCVGESSDAFDALDTSQVIGLKQGFLFQRSEVMLPRDQFTRMEPEDWILMMSGDQHE